jgi:dUTPase
MLYKVIAEYDLSFHPGECKVIRTGLRLSDPECFGITGNIVAPSYLIQHGIELQKTILDAENENYIELEFYHFGTRVYTIKKDEMLATIDFHCTYKPEKTGFHFSCCSIFA